MPKIKQLKENKESIYPVTHINAVLGADLKQNKLVPGDNIEIDETTGKISATSYDDTEIRNQITTEANTRLNEDSKLLPKKTTKNTVYGVDNNGDQTQYTAGNNIKLENNKISLTTDKVQLDSNGQILLGKKYIKGINNDLDIETVSGNVFISGGNNMSLNAGGSKLFLQSVGGRNRYSAVLRGRDNSSVLIDSYNDIILNIGRPQNINNYRVISNRDIETKTKFIENGEALEDKYALNGHTHNEICPIGTIMMFAGSTRPSNWLWCDGSRYTHTDPSPESGSTGIPTKYYPLFEVIGHTYDSTIKEDSFCVPNLQQRFPLGAKRDNNWKCGNQTYRTNLGDAYGEKEHKLIESELPTLNEDYFTTGQIWNNASTTSGQANQYLTPNGEGSEIEGEEITSFNNEAHNNIPPYLALNFIIRFQ